MTYITKYLNKIKKVGNRFYSFSPSGNNLIAISSDGKVWNDVTTPFTNHYILDISGDETNQMIVTNNIEGFNNTFCIFTSTNYVDFTLTSETSLNTSSVSLFKHGINYIIKTGQSLLTTIDGQILERDSRYDTELNNVYVIHDGTQYIKMDFVLNSKYASLDGEEWAYVENIPFTLPTGAKIFLANNKFFYNLLDNDSGQYITQVSSDGTTIDYSFQTGLLQELRYCNNGVYTAVGPYTSTVKNFLTSTDDGQTWDSVSTNQFTGFSTPFGFNFGNGVYCVKYGTNLYRSTDRITWVATLSSTNSPVLFDGTHFVTSSGAGLTFRYSTDANTWNDSNISGYYPSLEKFGNSIIAYGPTDNGIIISHDNGETFAELTLPLATSDYEIQRNLSYGTRLAFYIAVNGVRYYLFSDDYGSTWNLLPTDFWYLNLASSGFNVLDNGLVILVGFSEIMYSEDGMETWHLTERPSEYVQSNTILFYNGQYIWPYTDTQSGSLVLTILTSTDLITWTEESSTPILPTTEPPFGELFDFNGYNYIFKFVIRNESVNRDIDVILTSTNLLSWSSKYLNSHDNTLNWQAFEVPEDTSFALTTPSFWSNGVFLSGNRNNTSTSVTTTDYETWNIINLNIDTLPKLITSPTFFFATFADFPNGYQVLKSADGEQWEAIISDIIQPEALIVSTDTVAILSYDQDTMTLGASFYDYDGTPLNQSTILTDFDSNNYYWSNFFYFDGKWILLYADLVNGLAKIRYTESLGSIWVDAPDLSPSNLYNTSATMYGTPILGYDDEYGLTIDGINYTFYPTPWFVEGEFAYTYFIDYHAQLNLYMGYAYKDGVGFVLYTSINGIDWTERSWPNFNWRDYDDIGVIKTNTNYLFMGKTVSDAPELISTTDFVTYQTLTPTNSGPGEAPTGVVLGSQYQNTNNSVVDMATDRDTFNTVFLVSAGAA